MSMMHRLVDSWRLKIQHKTGFDYAGPVSSSYNEARMWPRNETHQAVLDARVEVWPPARTYRYEDYWGTVVTAFDVHAKHEALTVTATSTVETLPPGDLIEPGEGAAWDELAVPESVDRWYELLLADHAHRPGRRADRRSPPTSAAAHAHPARGGAGGLRVRPRRGHVSARRDRRADRRGARLGAAQGRLPGHQPPDRRAAARDGAAGPVRLRLPAPEAVGGDRGQRGRPEPRLGGVVGRAAGPAFDPTNGVPVGERHVVVGRGREYGDVPPLKGVYAGPESTGQGVEVTITRLR